MKFKIAITATAIWFSSAAMASPYIGGSIGKIDHDLPEFSKATAVEVYFGKRFNKNLALEAGYIDFGEASDSAPPVWTISGDSISISGKLIAPVSEKLEIYFRVGLHAWDAKVNEDGSGVIFDDDGTDILFGVGASFLLSERINLGLKYTNYDIDGDDSAALSASVDLKF